MNFRHLTGLAVSATLLMTLTSCNKKNNSRDINVKDIQANTKTTSSQKAEELAKASEQLMTFQGFAYADDVAHLALQLDSSNVRAQFVKAMLGPIMVNEGLAQRVKPLAAQDPESLEGYNKSMDNLDQKTPNSTYKSFLKNGAEDIRDEKDVQKHLDALADSFKALRDFAKNNKNAELTVMTTDSMFKAMQQRYGSACQIVQTEPGLYKAVNCPDQTALEVKLNRADFEALQMGAAGMELYVSLANSYKLTGTLEKALSLKGQNEIDAKAVIESMLENKEFATLRAGNGFVRMLEMGHEAVTGLRWIAQNQKTLCSMGKSNPKNRIGMLFNEGLCDQRTEAESLKGLAEAEEGLNGKASQATAMNKYGQIYKFNTRAVALTNSPIKDLRSILPTSFDKCGNALTVADPSLSGLITTQDANNILAHLADCDQL
jgi:hypothetical protein